MVGGISQAFVVGGGGTVVVVGQVGVVQECNDDDRAVRVLVLAAVQWMVV